MVPELQLFKETKQGKNCQIKCKFSARSKLWPHSTQNTRRLSTFGNFPCYICMLTVDWFFFKSKKCLDKKVLNFFLIKKNVSASSKNTQKNRNSLINDRKIQNQRLKTNRPSGFTSQECVKKIQLTKRIIEATLIKISLVTFLISVCLKIHIVPHDGKKGNI